MTKGEAPMANAIDDVKEWVLVPKVPTIAMMDAVHGGMAEQRELYIHIFTADVWEAMINAAPSQHTGWSDEAVEALAMAEKRLVEFARAVDAGEAQGGAREWERRIWASFAEHRAALTVASSIAPATGYAPRHIEIAHDGFSGDVIGSYITREGKRGFVVQQDDTRVVHVYGEKFAGISPSVAKESGDRRR